jgi:GNAT superfamily N-acetyltransferase
LSDAPAPVTLRQAWSSDAPFLYELAQLTLRSHVEGKQGHWDAATIRTRTRGWAESGQCELIYCGVDRVGAMLVELRDTYYWLEMMLIMPGWESEGVGSAIIHQLAERARSEKRTVRVSVPRDTPAQRLYKRLGFVVLGETPERIYMECR